MSDDTLVEPTNDGAYDAIVVGGGAAGFFGAIACGEASSRSTPRLLLLEKTQQTLSKVKISGGGRCNVTHSCFDPHQLIRCYPRGSKELLGPFFRFQPRDTIAWFEARGVSLKTEGDGRIFPSSDSSQTILDALRKAAAESGVQVTLGACVEQIKPEAGGFLLQLRSGQQLRCRQLLLALGGGRDGYRLAQELGHQIEEPLPSLFTFNLPKEKELHGLAGISVEQARVSLPELGRSELGPLLITHWGISGPAVLKLSAFAAKELYQRDYRACCSIDWLPEVEEETLQRLLLNASGVKDPCGYLPKHLWRYLVDKSCSVSRQWTRQEREQLTNALKRDCYQIEGTTRYKSEFVTCGGVALHQVDFRTMQSRLVPALFFAGELLNIDGITGGFNFQAAWTTGWIAGQAMAVSL